MGGRQTVAVLLAALCAAAALHNIAGPATADGPAPGEPQVVLLDAHRCKAIWTFPGPAGYFLDDVVVTAAGVELAVNQTTGERAAYGTLTTSDLRLENLTSYDYLEFDPDIPDGCRISFWTSTDGGGSWHAVPPNGSLQGTGRVTGMIRVRSELWTSNGSFSPVLRSILLRLTVDRPPEILSLTCTKEVVYKREIAAINSRVIDPDGDPLSYQWSQTEGTEARLGRTDQPSLEFTPAYNGPHTFQLSVSDGLGAPQVASLTVDVLNHPPLISFEMDGTPYKRTHVHIFAGVYSADGTLMRFDWRLVRAPPFTTMVQPTVPDIVLYAFYTGECTVSLTVTDDRGTNGTANFTFDFIGHPPRAALTADRNDGHAGQIYTFDASRSSDPDGDPLQYRFDFGDGTTTDWVNFPDIDHVYDRTGLFTVRVRVRDVDGLVADAQYPVRVRPRNHPPAAALQVTPGSLTDPFSFVSVSNDQDGTIVWTEWDFGDGGTATGTVVSHLFSSPGNYTVRLWVRDDDGETTSASALININRPPALVSRNPPGDIALSPDQGFNLSVEAVDPDGDPLSYSWSVNGEPLPSETSNAHRFVPGKEDAYDITVFVDDGRGGGTNYTWNLTVLPQPAPAPQPVYTLLAIIVVALAAQGVFLMVEVRRSRARRRMEREAGNAPAAAPAPTERQPASLPGTPMYGGPPPEPMPQELPLPEAQPLELPLPELPPPEMPFLDMEPPEAQQVMEEIPGPEPLAEVLWPEEPLPPYRRPPPPF